MAKRARFLTHTLGERSADLSYLLAAEVRLAGQTKLCTSPYRPLAITIGTSRSVTIFQSTLRRIQ